MTKKASKPNTMTDLALALMLIGISILPRKKTSKKR